MADCSSAKEEQPTPQLQSRKAILVAVLLTAYECFRTSRVLLLNAPQHRPPWLLPFWLDRYPLAMSLTNLIFLGLLGLAGIEMVRQFGTAWRALMASWFAMIVLGQINYFLPSLTTPIRCIDVLIALLAFVISVASLVRTARYPADAGIQT